MNASAHGSGTLTNSPSAATESVDSSSVVKKAIRELIRVKVQQYLDELCPNCLKLKPSGGV